jgi:predicted HTH transcriptional regulator
MTPKELLNIISAGESSTVEFKRKISSFEKIAKEISAFANTKGGYILIGIDDNGHVRGVESEKNDIEQIITACNFYLEPPVIPEIEIVEVYGNDVIVCVIEESKHKPHFIKENPDEPKSLAHAYIRHGEQSVIASKEMTRVLAKTRPDSEPVKLSIGDHERRLFVWLENNGRATVNDFAKISNISRRRAERLLVRLVKAGIIQIHVDTSHDYFTLV